MSTSPVVSPGVRVPMSGASTLKSPAAGNSAGSGGLPPSDVSADWLSSLMSALQGRGERLSASVSDSAASDIDADEAPLLPSDAPGQVPWVPSLLQSVAGAAGSASAGEVPEASSGAGVAQGGGLQNDGRFAAATSPDLASDASAESPAPGLPTLVRAGGPGGFANPPSPLTQAATAAAGDGATDGMPVAQNPMDRLLQQALRTGALQDAQGTRLRVVATGGVHEALDAEAGSTRRKVLDALQGLGARSWSPATGSESVVMDAAFLGGGTPSTQTQRLSRSDEADAWVERPVVATGLEVFVATGDTTGTAASVPAERMAGSEGGVLLSDHDWMEALEKQVSIGRLRETDRVRLDLELQGAERMSLEAQLTDGVLTVRLGARSDGMPWVSPEQLEALTATLRAASPDIASVVLEQNGDSEARPETDQRSGRDTHDRADAEDRSSADRTDSSDDRPRMADRRAADGATLATAAEAGGSGAESMQGDGGGRRVSAATGISLRA